MALDYILDLFTGIVAGMRVYPERMLQNMELTRGLLFSQRLMLTLIREGRQPGRRLQGDADELGPHVGQRTPTFASLSAAIPR